MNNGDECEVPKEFSLDGDHGLGSKARRRAGTPPASNRIAVAQSALKAMTPKERGEFIAWLKAEGHI